jgi:hypothetical protein
MAEVITAPNGRFGRFGGRPAVAAPGVPFEALCPTPPFSSIGSLTVSIPPFRGPASDPLRGDVHRPSDKGLAW